ncbi:MULTISPECIES: succinylglutamate desuccinylase/aspartoacylase domain-containing protein [unclassified Cellulophaga]|uniref:succinylglutamate desuccinylase/aspartoacylase domain-containing protein n=1 Tax=unclassified Cellulophaga TaxID=2634405 RepID=UPI0026E3B568|nr:MULTISPECIES: succinylglutamate desuccinylase/aspartoacylase family protein [unclassified Cellulophaga]MDO6490453.1 succinylglutamate desuccinylase/aspartoacylase family protein [Cellulophaga sp. 2_MG-2023]MDO6494353.1 succinylglutamate desuccinylase/aspartoacylase family protein [Cellulophaga sp. 3_MG-2023]
MKLVNYLSIFLLFFCSITLVQGQQNIDSILNNKKSGSRTDLKIHFTDNESKTYVPITIIKGIKPGPTLTIVAGVHGYEYPPIVALQEFLNEINVQGLKGNIIVIPIANIGSFYGRSPFVNPLDNVNLNNAFPGDVNGSITQKIAYFITKKIIPVSDVFLDIHGGDANEDLLPFVCYYDNRNNQEKTAKAAQLSKSSGFSNIVSYNYSLKDSEPAKYMFKQAVQDGKVALSFEAGKLGTVHNEAVDLNKNGIYSILKELKMYNAKVVAPGTKNYFNKQSYIKSTEKGIFYSNLKAGDYIKTGDAVGVIKDEFGKTLVSINAPSTGIVLYKIGTPPVNIGETVMCIGTPIKK